MNASAPQIAPEAAAHADTAPRARSHSALAALRLLLLVLLTVYLYVRVAVARASTRDPALRYTRVAQAVQRWLVSAARIIGLRLTVEGPLPPPGSLLAPNHMGYADVVALGAVTPVFFVAKIEIASWPILGALFRHTLQIGVARQHSRGLRGTSEAVAQRLHYGQRVCVFLESTTTGGDRLLPFRSPLAEPAVQVGAPLVPVALLWGADRPGVSVRRDVAYWGGHHLGRHVWRLLGLRGVTCTVRFGEPIAAQGMDRKQLAAAAERAVARLCGYHREGGVAS